MYNKIFEEYAQTLPETHRKRLLKLYHSNQVFRTLIDNITALNADDRTTFIKNIEAHRRL